MGGIIGVGVLAAVAAGVAYSVIKGRTHRRLAHERKALAASQAAETGTPAELDSQIPTEFHAQAPTKPNQRSAGGILSGLWPKKDTEPRRRWYGSQAPTQATQEIELDVSEQPQISGPYTRLGDSHHIPRK